MSIVFYDTETTGTNTSFDQILQFAAIRTDSELKEQDRFEIRCRLQPHIIPAPGAVRVTGVSIEQLTDPELPSHYEMVRTIRDKLLSWSPAVFVGYNSIHFDEHLLRQAFYQTLHPPYLTNTNGSHRTDAMRMVQAASIYAPGALTVPLNAGGNPFFKLEHLAPANGFDHADAHDALADVQATIEMCRLVMDRAPDVWSAFMRFSQKAAVRDHIDEEIVISLSDIYPSGAKSYLVTELGPNEVNNSEHYVFDLEVDPAEPNGLEENQLAARQRRYPKPVRLVKCNGAPMLMAAEDAPEIARSRDLGLEELERRAEYLRANKGLCGRLIAAYEATRKVRGQAVHVEEKIYDGFPNDPDKARMESFHEAPWEQRSAIVETFEDPRLIELGRRLIAIERPDILDKVARQEADIMMARRIAVPEDSAPWLTLEKAIQDTEEMIAEANDNAERILLEPLCYFLKDKLDHARTVLA